MRRKLVISLLAFVAVIAGTWLLTSNQPRYRGKTVGAWFKQYYRYDVFVFGLPPQFATWRLTSPPSQHQEAFAALRAMGTNAVPYLLKEYYNTTTDTPFRTNLHALLLRLPKRIRPDPYVPADMVRMAAFRALGEMSPHCNFLLPLVTNRLHNGNPDDRLKTINLLCALQCGADEVMPFLRKMLLDTNDQKYATIRLVQLELAARPALPDLVELINKDDSDPEAVYHACGLIGRFGEAGSNAIPRLQVLLTNDTNAGLFEALGLPFEVVKSLCWIKPNQISAIQFLRASLSSRTNRGRSYALQAIAEIGPNAKAIAPELVQVAKENNEFISNLAITNLVLVGETNLAVQTAAETLSGREPRSRVRAIFFILQHDPTNSLAISNLVTLIRHEAWGGVAIAACADSGRVPQAVVSAIREIADDDKAYFQWQAKNALRAIGASSPRHELHSP